ncbi:YcnI family protein [Streptomyces sp. NPDC018693]|uniref:YcnI family copper-binding membrane protein n=1 Tax=unclassified Streptomyces TaxID=2593676 RepID=UPI0037916973
MSRTLPKVIGALTATAGIVLAGALPASAHITVSEPSAAVEGSFPTLTFRVPNERVSTRTAKVQIILPTEASSKLGNVLAKPHPGWTHKIEKVNTGGNIGEGVLSVTWTANSNYHQIKAGDFDEFQILGGRIPAVDTIYFTAVQTYNDGEVVRWDERPTSEEPHPPHAAPALKVVPASTAATTTNASLQLAGTGTTGTESTDSGSPVATPLMAVSAVGLAGIGGLALVRRRREQSAAAE